MVLSAAWSSTKPGVEPGPLDILSWTWPLASLKLQLDTNMCVCRLKNEPAALDGLKFDLVFKEAWSSNLAPWMS